ncbi:MAG TPA: alpha/beta hydrolase [Candidatus Sulfotelmatobacter sp.]|nr:alpha/beta hydrolase [Candidatus Sulfotelmatobacter sp.]
MASVTANGISIEYEEIGDKSAPAILLVMGLGAQLTRWSDTFCQALADGGFRTIRFDNRDCGLSSKFEAAGVPNMAEMFQKATKGETIAAPYRLEDMALDAVGLMDRLGLAKAHIVGASMGGMIAQVMAARHPNRTASLVSIMSSSGRRGLPPGKPEAMQAIMTRPESGEREALIQNSMRASRIIGSPGYPEDEAVLRRQAERNVDRSYYPQGVSRQFAAVLASGSRVDLLKTITAPSLVIHGNDDPLVPVEAGRDTAAHIPGAELMLVPGMGHAIESKLVPIVAPAILAHCRKAMAVA